MKNLFFVVLISLIGFATQAQEKKNKNAKYTIKVNGNCELCQKRIQKAAFSVDGVKTATWSIETHKLEVTLNEEKGTVAEIKKAVAKVGHDAGEVRATNETYEKLHHCCLYERKQ